MTKIYQLYGKSNEKANFLRSDINKSGHPNRDSLTYSDSIAPTTTSYLPHFSSSYPWHRALPASRPACRGILMLALRLY